jgi:hypothetical protein
MYDCLKTKSKNNTFDNYFKIVLHLKSIYTGYYMGHKSWNVASSIKIIPI